MNGEPEEGQSRKRSKWTVMLIPHDNESVRSIHVSTSGVRAILSGLLVIVLLVATVTTAFFVEQGEQMRRRQPSDRTSELREELLSANERLYDGLTEADQLMREFVEESRTREQEIAELQRRYSSLQALVAGQEEIARAHREILSQRSIAERLTDMGLGILTGIIGSLIATWIYVRPRIRFAPGEEVSDL